MEDADVSMTVNMDQDYNDNTSSTSFLTALIAGGIAGMSVDIALFPIDTIKVRIQSPLGFRQAGGFQGLYKGLGAAAAGSAPGAALFFCTYELMKPFLLNYYDDYESRQIINNNNDPFNGNDDTSSMWLFASATTALIGYQSLCHMLAASMGEVAACLVRVPTEVVKAKLQTSNNPSPKLWETVQAVFQERHGGSLLTNVTGGLYRGYGITLFREIPFAMIQFPLYEQLKLMIASWQYGDAVSPLQAAACGSLSGAIAGALTTPLDVLKTRLQLGQDKDNVPYKGVRDVFTRTVNNEGYGALWRGLQPRVFWISIGGFVFFGAYETARSCIQPVLG